MKSNLPSAHLTAVLSIAGSDSSGGAGIQADIKTITAHKLYAMTAITAVTAQNTTGVYSVSEMTPAVVEAQLDCIFSDIPPDAVKIGMVSNADIIRTIAERLSHFKARHIVVDPVMVSTSGARLLNPAAKSELIRSLFPLAELITPNIPEAEELTGKRIISRADMLDAALFIVSLSKSSVLLKGGHLTDCADDLLLTSNKMLWLPAGHIDTPNTHGTGCTLSSAIACGLAKGLELPAAVKEAKEYVTGALAWGLDLGKGCGPLNHMFRL